MPPKLLSVTGEVGLSADRRIVARRSTPSLERALGFDSNPPSGETARATTATPSGQERLSDPVDRSAPTRDSLDAFEVRATPIAVPPPRPSRRPLYAGLALLLVGLVAGGVAAIVLVGSNRAAPTSAAAEPTPPSANAAPSPEVVAATPDPVAVPVASSPSAAGPNVGGEAASAASSGTRATSDRPRPPSVDPGPAAVSTSPPGPTISERRRVTAPPRARDPERGANGSLILD